MIKKTTVVIAVVVALGCNSNKNKTHFRETPSDINIVGAMKNVMWNGELDGRIYLDTISNKKGLYGLGPQSHLTGELLIKNGESFISKVASDSTMTVEKTFDASAPFFVYANVSKWTEIPLAKHIKSVKDIENLVTEKATIFKKPFAFKLKGRVSKATIHIQNLPKGTKVSSPKEAHQGQTNYILENQDVTLVGFYSTVHKGVFTHHDSNIHIHLITDDNSKMGHLDDIEIKDMKLFIPSTKKLSKI